MKRLMMALACVVGMLALAACSDCSIVEDKGNPQRQFRLEDEAGNSLWFGDSARYDPEDAIFEHPTQGILPATVNASLQSVGVTIPLTDQEEESILLRLDSVKSSTIVYTSFMYEEKCSRVYELSYIKQDGTKICSLCGSQKFENDGFIYLNE